MVFQFSPAQHLREPRPANSTLPMNPLAAELDRSILSLRIKRWLLPLIARLVFYSGALRLINLWPPRRLFSRRSHPSQQLPYIIRERGRNVQILFYHRVNDENDPYFPATPTQSFGKQMEHLARYFNVLPLLDAVARIQAKDIPENALVITFDDGYRDNYIHAYPILKDLSLPATIFLATGSIETDRPLWHDLVFSAFRRTRQLCLSNFGNCSDVYPLATVHGRLYAQRRVIEFLWTLDHSERMFWIETLRDTLCVGNSRPQVGLMLTWDDIRLMHAHGIAFGSHTVNHPILTRVPKEVAEREIRNSKRMIERQLCAPVNCFAYPNGRQGEFNVETAELLKAAGYVCGLTTVFGANDYASDVYELRRLGPPNGDVAEFALKLRWYKRLVCPRI